MKKQNPLTPVSDEEWLKDRMLALETLRDFVYKRALTRSLSKKKKILNPKKKQTKKYG